jgi:hypothetical protein
MTSHHFNQRKLLLCLLMVLCAGGLAGCDNPLSFLADLLTGESAKWRDLAQVQAQGAVRAIPGERYLQIIDAVNGTNDVKKKEAQEFLRRLGNLDNNATIRWVGTATFSFDPAKELHANVFWGFSDSKEQVQFFMRNAYDAKQAVVSTGYRNQTMDELNAQIDSGVDTFLTTLQGTNPGGIMVSPGGTPGSFAYSPPTYIPMWYNSLSPNTSYVVAAPPIPDSMMTREKVLASAKATKDAAATTMKSLLKAQYAKMEIPVGSTTLSIPWHPEEAKSLFFILIPDEDWQKHKNDSPHLSIQVTLHKEGDLKATYPGTGSFEVPLAEFDGSDSREPVPVRFGGGKVRWAVVDPTRSSASLPDLAPDKMQNMQHLLTLVNQINAGTSVAPRISWGRILARISVLIVVLVGLLAFGYWFFKMRKVRRRR